jgi:hypothetical protein
MADDLVSALERAHATRMLELTMCDGLVRRITGLHHITVGHADSYYMIIKEQRKKIAGLKLQITQMKRGYERKIARLERAGESSPARRG